MDLAAPRRQYRQQKRLVAAAVRQASQLWRKGMDPDVLEASFTRRVLPDLLDLTAGAQFAAAELGAAYVDDLREELDLEDAGTGVLRPASLAGVAANGADLDRALAGALFTTKEGIAKGLTPARALRAGQLRLTGRVQQEVADAGRIGTSVTAMADKRLKLYVRMLTTPSCSRCVLLAGKTYAMAEAFQRHPRCDCRHIPVTENVAGDLTTDPMSYFESLDEAEQDRIFTRAGAQAVRDGADLGQVVNARSGMYTTRSGALNTTAGTSRRGAYGSSQTEFDKRTGARYRTARRARPMPERIYELAGGNRDEAIRLLRYYRYIL